jgi:hypothetical protein
VMTNTVHGDDGDVLCIGHAAPFFVSSMI